MALHPGKELLAYIDEEVGWAAEPVWIFGNKRNLPPLAGF
jgi:hypothetical protein